MRIVPLTYCSFLSEEEVARHECSDRIWVPQVMFQRWLLAEEVGSVVIVRIEGVVACMYGPHTDGNLRIYAPTWMCRELGVSLDPPEDEDDYFEVERIQPDLCRFLQVQPHTSDHLYTGDPEETLSRAFEEYTCVAPGQTLTLRLPNGICMEATILTSEPAEGPLCIRNAEITLDLLQPLDAIPEPLTPEPLIEPVHFVEPAATTTPSMPSREERRALYAAAALQRLQKNTTAEW